MTRSTSPTRAATRAATAAAVVVAAGSSTRMLAASGTRKPALDLEGRPLIEHTLASFAASERVAEVVLVVHADDVETYERACADVPAFAKVCVVVPGGAERSDSVRAGVFWCSYGVDVIAVHDAARPLIAPACIDRAIERAAAEGAALVAVPVHDTIKTSPDGERVENTLDRSVLWSAQTPQIFEARRFRELVRRAEREDFRPTDDSALWERYVGPVAIERGDPSNLKITTPDDLTVARAILRAREEQRA